MPSSFHTCLLLIGVQCFPQHTRKAKMVMDAVYSLLLSTRDNDGQHCFCYLIFRDDNILRRSSPRRALPGSVLVPNYCKYRGAAFACCPRRNVRSKIYTAIYFFDPNEFESGLYHIVPILRIFFLNIRFTTWDPVFSVPPFKADGL